MIYLFNMIFAAFTKGYIDSENEDIPVFRGIGLIVIIQITMTMFLQKWIDSKYCFINKYLGGSEFKLLMFEMGLFLIINLIYFNQKRVNKILIQYGETSFFIRSVAILLGVSLLIFPLVLYI